MGCVWWGLAQSKLFSLTPDFVSKLFFNLIQQTSPLYLGVLVTAMYVTSVHRPYLVVLGSIRLCTINQAAV